MFKQIVTLVRGRSFDAAEQVIEANALSILRQQIRDCAEAVNSARRAAALATAQLDQEAGQHAMLSDQISGLEMRTLAALQQGKLDLAREGAEVIARFEAERETSQIAQRAFSAEIEKLKSTVRNSERRLRELERGQRLAVTAQNTMRLRQSGPAMHLTALKEAEDTLQMLRGRQKMEEVAEAALCEMELSWCPQGLEERLIEAGCGPAIANRVDDVLTRLQAQIDANTETPNV
ncbi:MAG: PspA/IM30 family protein [Rhizobiaceae bacterium]